MSYTKDRDKAARGVGSIAARDLVSRRGQRRLAKQAHHMAKRDAILAKTAIQGFMGFGAVSLDAQRGYVDPIGQGTHPAGGGGGSGGGPLVTAQKYGVTVPIATKYTNMTMFAPVQKYVPPLAQKYVSQPLMIVGSTSGGGGGVVSGGGGGGGVVVDPGPSTDDGTDLPPAVDPGTATTSELFGLSTKNLLILAALGVGGYYLLKGK